MRKQYFVVKWGNVIRLTTNKHNNIIDACFDCYGMAATNMEVKALSSRVAQVRNIKWRQEQIKNREGWVSPEKEVYHR